MGNFCCQDHRPPSLAEDKQPDHKPNSRIVNMTHSNVVSELSNLPAISKNILDRMQELGFFGGTNIKDLKPIYQLRNRSIYQGPLQNRQFHGQGRLFLNDGSIIESHFQAGEPRGQTRIFKANGDYFCGVVLLDNKIEKAVVFQKGIKYEGEMLDQKPHGRGTQTSKSFSFHGEYSQGKKIKGILRWNLDNPKYLQLYEGGFVDNLFQGNGILINKQGKYSGQFEKGYRSGQGTLQFPDGSKYIGEFHLNKQHGTGKLYDLAGNILKQGLWTKGRHNDGEPQ